MRFIEDVIDRQETKHRKTTRKYAKRLKQMYRHAQEHIRADEQAERTERRIAKLSFINI